MRTRYPYQIDSIIHKNKEKTIVKTLGFDENLHAAKGESDDRKPTPPFEMHEGFSVFNGILIEKYIEVNSKTGYEKEISKKTVSFNIQPKEVPFILKKTELAMQKALFKEPAKQELSNANKKSANSPAYNVTFGFGNLKGKNPAQLLIESESNVDVLKGQKEFLEEQLVKYPNNKKIIEAIDDALALYNAGTLSDDIEINIEDTNVYVIFHPPARNKTEVDENNYNLIYEINIEYDFMRNYPIFFEVKNFYAPVIRVNNENIIQSSKAVKEKKISMYLDEMEWYIMIEKMKKQKDLFENMIYPGQVNLADEIAEKNKEEALKNKVV